MLDLSALTVDGWSVTSRAGSAVHRQLLPPRSRQPRPPPGIRCTHRPRAMGQRGQRQERQKERRRRRRRRTAEGDSARRALIGQPMGSGVPHWPRTAPLTRPGRCHRVAPTPSAPHTPTTFTTTAVAHLSPVTCPPVRCVCSRMCCVLPLSVLPVLGVVEDAVPFVCSLHCVDSFTGRVVSCLLVLHDSLVRCGGYDARVRVMLRRMTRLLDVRWEWWVSQESRYAKALKRAVEQRGGGGGEESSSSRALRYLKIGSAVVIGGVAIGLTGGLLAAPLLGAGLAGIGLTSAGATVTALVASTSGVVLVSSLFGIGQPPTHPQHTPITQHSTPPPSAALCHHPQHLRHSHV